MAEFNKEGAEVNARIVYWGIEGAGKTTNLHAIYSKLRPDHRGEMQELPTRFDPTVTYEQLPIELGEIAGMRTRIQMIAVPGSPEQAPTRKQLLDQVDGVVLIVDSQATRIDENVASLEELRKALEDYGRCLDDLPLVVQYNKQDLADPYAIEELHRKLLIREAPVFEAVATDKTGVLQTLSTISKRVVRSLRDQGREGPPQAPAQPRPAPAAQPRPAPPKPREAPPAPPVEPIERAILEEDSHPDASAIAAAAQRTEVMFDQSWEEVSGEIERGGGMRLGPDLSIVSVGEATRVGERSVRVPLVLGDADGRTATFALTIQLDALADENAD